MASTIPTAGLVLASVLLVLTSRFDVTKLQDFGWHELYYTITLGVTGTVYIDSIACVPQGTPTFTLCARANCTIVSPYDVESYAWLGHAASSIR